MNNLVIQIIRTVSSFVLGLLFTWLISLGIDIPEDIKAEITATLPVFIGSLWYIAIAWLESKIPALGWLIGVAKKPVYSSEEAKKEYKIKENKYTGFSITGPVSSANIIAPEKEEENDA